MFYILEGEAEITLVNEILRTKPGDMVYLPGGIKHGIKIVGSKPARVLNIVIP